MLQGGRGDRFVWYLYRIYTAEPTPRLLYVGITHRHPPATRVAEHEGKWWWRWANPDATTIAVMFAGETRTQYQAEQEEARQIRLGRPLANKAENGARGHQFEEHFRAGGRLEDWPPAPVRRVRPAGSWPPQWVRNAAAAVVLVGAVLVVVVAAVWSTVSTVLLLIGMNI